MNIGRRNYRCSSPSRFLHTLRCSGHVALVSALLLSSISSFRSALRPQTTRMSVVPVVRCSAPFSSTLSFIFSVTSRYVFICSRLSCFNTFDITVRLFFRSKILLRYINRCWFKNEFPWRRMEESQKLSHTVLIPALYIYYAPILYPPLFCWFAQCKIPSRCLSKMFFPFPWPSCRYLRRCSSNFLPLRSRALCQTHSICFVRVCKEI